MTFHVDQYLIDGYGHLMIMHTVTKMGMELLTMSFMPSTGVNLPYLLIDAMTVAKKKCVFVEYYGCGNEDLNDPTLQKTYEQYCSLTDYEEKPNWYVSEREPYSLIKSGTAEQLISMTTDSISAYLSSIAGANASEAYRSQLAAFRQRMITEGNPSSRTLEMLLKKDGAVKFMKEVIMPVKI